MITKYPCEPQLRDTITDPEVCRHCGLSLRISELVGECVVRLRHALDQALVASTPQAVGLPILESPPVLTANELAFVRRGYPIQAIKSVRERTGLGFAEARRYVEWAAAMAGLAFDKLSPRAICAHEDGLGLTELCLVHAVDAPHPVNGANHVYSLDRVTPQGTVNVGSIQFQRGPRDAPDSTPGTLDGAVLAILIDRVESFQAGPFGCLENEVVLGHLNEALRLIKARAHERAGRGVLGKNEK